MPHSRRYVTKAGYDCLLVCTNNMLGLIREEDKTPTPSSPPPLFSVIPGGFIKQLVRETEKESKEARQKDKQTKDETQVNQDPAPDVLKSPGKLSNNLVQQFLLKDENILFLENEMEGENSEPLASGLNGDKNREQVPEKIPTKKPLSLKIHRNTGKKQAVPISKQAPPTLKQEKTTKPEDTGNCKSVNTLKENKEEENSVTVSTAGTEQQNNNEDTIREGWGMRTEVKDSTNKNSISKEMAEEGNKLKSEMLARSEERNEYSEETVDEKHDVEKLEKTTHSSSDKETTNERCQVTNQWPENNKDQETIRDERDMKEDRLNQNDNNTTCRYIKEESNENVSENTDSEKIPDDVWYETEQVWFVHKDGFSLATELKPDVGTAELPEGRVRIRIDADNTVLEVDEENIHRTNPSKLDYAEDLATLVSLNESSVINTLQHRYQSQLIHTYAGPNLVVMKPSTTIPNYSGKVFKGKKDSMPPHICAVAQKAYWNMLLQRQDQTIVPLGRSGAGKTTNCQNALEYLVGTAGSVDCRVTVEKIQAMFTVLKAFGTVSTSQGSHSTRFSMVTSLDFNAVGRVTAAHLQTMLLERIRVAQQPEGESNFHVFAYMLAGVDMELRTELYLNQMPDSNSFGIMPCAKPEEKQKASASFVQLQAAMETLGFAAREQKAIWHVLAGIYHLGAAGACRVGRKQFMKFDSATNAANVLGCDCEELSTAVFKHHLKQIIEQVTSGVRRLGQEEDRNAGPKMTGVECVEGMAVGLYEELFAVIVSLINRSFSSSYLSLASIMVMDTPGFQNPRHQKKERAATFEELCHNYGHERLQSLFYKRTFVAEMERYHEENVEVSFDLPELSPDETVSVIDQMSSQLNVQPNGQAEEPRGLLWILDEEVLTQGSNDSAVLDRLCSYFEKKGIDNEEEGPICKCEQPLQCEIFHQMGKDPVRYDFTSWITRAKLNLSAQNAIQILQQTKMDNVKSLFLSRSKFPLICRSVAGLEGNSQHALQRIGCVRKTFTSSFAAVNRRSVCAQIKLQMDALTNLVKRSQIHFVHCVVPRSGVDGCDWKISHPCRAGAEVETLKTAIDVPTVRTQLFGAQLLDALRLFRIGYTDRMGIIEFRRRFQVLALPVMKKYTSAYDATDENKAIAELFQSLDLDKKSVVVGRSQVFLKSGVLSKLERQRDKLISKKLILFQATCKGFLCRQKLKKLKIQRVALRCIQKNLAKFRDVKDWPWWELLCQIRPSLFVNIDENMFRAKEEEIQVLRRKLDKSEKSRNEHRQNADQLESKIIDLMTELSDERFKGDVACQVLEGERAERLRASREIKDMQNKYEQLQKNLDSVTKQLEDCQQQIQLRDLGMGITGGADEWQMRFDCAQTEIQFLRKRLTQFEERLESELKCRRELDERLSSVQSAYEEAKRTAQHSKRKCKHLTSDLEDTRVLMESQQSRNHELEKKQRKFDVQLAQALGEAAFEKSLREKVSQENTACRWELGKLQHRLEEKEKESEKLNKRIEVLSTQLNDLSSSDSLGEHGVASLKKRVWELEASATEQSQQLTEQANAIQQLEQTRLRFEMEIERMKQIHQKELEDKDEELEDVRQSCQRRLRQLEMQLEQEFEEKQMVLHEKQDLEGLIGTLCDQIGHRDFDVEKRLRRDLKRTHALLADLQLLLETMDNSGQPSNKVELEKVQAQLEESEGRYAESLKSQKILSMELENIHVELENICRNKNMVEEQLYQMQHEKCDLLKRTDEDQEDLNELMKKHKALIAQSANDINQIRDLQAQLEDSQKERQTLQEKLQAAQSRIVYLEHSMVERSIVSKQESVICDLENKMEFQIAQIKRFEILILRLRDSVLKMGEELEKAAESEAREKENAKYYQMRLDEMKHDMNELFQREMEASRRCVELDTQLGELVAVRETLHADLQTSIRRIADLQAALEEVQSSDDSDTESVQTAVESFCSKRDSDCYSSIGSSISLEPAGSVKSWMGSSASWASPSGASVAGSASRLSRGDASSQHSVRMNIDLHAPDVARPCSSESSRRRDYGSRLGKDDSDNRKKTSLETIDEVNSMDALSGKKRSSPSEDKCPSSSLALSEFVEELRRKRANEREQASLGMEDASPLPIYQTTGASSLRRCRTFNDDEEQFPPKAKSPSETGPIASSTSLTRSSSLRSIPSDPTLSPAVKRMARFGSCESLLQSQNIDNLNKGSSLQQLDDVTSSIIKPRRRCLETPLEEAAETEFGKEPLVFQNKQYSSFMTEETGKNPLVWKTSGMSYARSAEDYDDFLPAVRRTDTKNSLSKSRKDAQRPLSVRFGDLPSNNSVTDPTVAAKLVLRKSPTNIDDPGNHSDSSSSSGSIVSFKSADSIKTRPRFQRLEGEGCAGKSTPSGDAPESKRAEAEGREDNVNSIMMKYLRKTEEEQGPLI
ncbi:unconventional myosin-XVIIIb [Ambystoma mexicanum]|uniref:unconventional myosin-XVIIIb n=1 Tax=Ambystoma mexicanum TaxID=8296 RepID=UPI0037E926EA